MPAFSRVKTWASGEVLTAAELNGEFDNIINNFTLTNLDDYSSNVAQMQEIANPGSVSSESLATSLSGELTRLRYMLKAIHGGAQWYASALTGWITTAMIGNDQITNAKIADDAVDTEQLADGAVTSDKLDIGSLTPANLPTVSLGQAKFGLPSSFGFGYSMTGGATTSYTPTVVSRASNVTSCTLSATPSAVDVGQIFRLLGCTTTSFNGAFLVLGKSGNTLYLYNPGADGACTIGAGTADSGPWKEYVPTATIGFGVSSQVIGSITRASNVVTLTPTGGPGSYTATVGQKVMVAGNTTASFSGLHTVTSYNAGTGAITYAQTGVDETGTPSSGTCYVLLACELTTNGRPTAVGLQGGSAKLTAVTSTAAGQLRIYRPDSTYSFSSIAIAPILNSLIRGVSDFTETTTPATVYVSNTDGSFNVSDSLPLSLQVTATRMTQVPLASYRVVEPTLAAGTYDYFVTMVVTDDLGNIMTTSDTFALQSPHLVAYEF